MVERSESCEIYRFVALTAIIMPDFTHSTRRSRYEISGVSVMTSTHRIDKRLVRPFVFIKSASQVAPHDVLATCFSPLGNPRGINRAIRTSTLTGLSNK